MIVLLVLVALAVGLLWWYYLVTREPVSWTGGLSVQYDVQFDNKLFGQTGAQGEALWMQYRAREKE